MHWCLPPRGIATLSSHSPSPSSWPGHQFARAVIPSLFEQCTLLWGTLTTEDKFFLQEDLGGELSTRKECVAIQRDVLKCLGILEQRTFGSRYHCCQSKWSLGLITASSSPLPSPRFPSQEKGVVTPHKRQTQTCLRVFRSLL